MTVIDAVIPTSRLFKILPTVSREMPPEVINDAAVRRRSLPRKSGTVNVAAASAC
jgi:hypothetical protein